MYVHLIALDKNPGVRPVGVRETWQRIFDKIVLKVTGSEATMTCQDDQLSTRIKSVINGVVHGVQDIWDKIMTTEDWGFFVLVDAQNAFNKIN